MCETGHLSGATNRLIWGGSLRSRAFFHLGSSGCEHGKANWAEMGLIVRTARPDVCETGAGGMSHVIWVQSGHVDRVTAGLSIATSRAATVGLQP